MTQDLNATKTQEQVRQLTEEELQIVAAGTQTGQFRSRYQTRLDKAQELLG